MICSGREGCQLHWGRTRLLPELVRRCCQSNPQLAGLHPHAYQSSRRSHRPTNPQTHRQTHRTTDTQTHRHTHRPTDTQTHRHTHTHLGGVSSRAVGGAGTVGRGPHEAVAGWLGGHPGPGLWWGASLGGHWGGPGQTNTLVPGPLLGVRWRRRGGWRGALPVRLWVELVHLHLQLSQCVMGRQARLQARASGRARGPGARMGEPCRAAPGAP